MRKKGNHELATENTPVASNRVGLANFAAKYRLLARRDVGTEDSDGYFTVRVPLPENGTIPPPRRLSRSFLRVIHSFG
jgi:hypothetical protein